MRHSLGSQKKPRVDTPATLQTHRAGLCRRNGGPPHCEAPCRQEHPILSRDLLPKASMLCEHAL